MAPVIGTDPIIDAAAGAEAAVHSDLRLPQIGDRAERAAAHLMVHGEKPADRSPMDLLTLLLAATLASLFLTGAGLLAAMVVLERASAPAHRGQAPQRSRPRRF